MKVFKTHYPDVNDENRIESDKLELNYPKIFFGMYNFWVTKIMVRITKKLNNRFCVNYFFSY